MIQTITCGVLYVGNNLRKKKRNLKEKCPHNNLISRDEETEAQRGSISGLRLTAVNWESQGWNPGLRCPESMLGTTMLYTSKLADGAWPGGAWQRVY